MRKQKDGFSGERALIVPAPLIQEAKRDPLYSNLYVTDIGYYPFAVNHYRERTEPIAQYILIYCVEGSGFFSLSGKTYPVVKDQFFLLPPHIPHTYGADETTPWTIYWMHYGGTMANHYSAGLYSPQAIQPHVHSRIKDRINLFEEIFQTLEWGYSKENLLYSSSVLYYFLASLKFVGLFRGRQSGLEQIDIIEASIHFMKENIEKKLTVEEIASHIGYSDSHFVALFHERTGYSPIAYFNQLKIQRACQLLDLTTMKINQICHKVGIKDCYYFSRLFNKAMGISPLAYRLLKKG